VTTKEDEDITEVKTFTTEPEDNEGNETKEY
jgi:hypothetical protein